MAATSRQRTVSSYVGQLPLLRMERENSSHHRFGEQLVLAVWRRSQLRAKKCAHLLSRAVASTAPRKIVTSFVPCANDLPLDFAGTDFAVFSASSIVLVLRYGRGTGARVTAAEFRSAYFCRDAADNKDSIRLASPGH